MKELRESIEKILADSVHTAITRIGIPEPSNQAYAEAKILFGHGNGSITQMENFLAKQIGKESADQILTLLEGVIPTEQNYPLKASIDTPEEDARELRYFDGYNQAIADIKDKLK